MGPIIMSSNSILSKLLIIPPLALGAGVLWFAISNRPPPEQVDAKEAAAIVRVVTLAEQPVAPRLLGYGTVRPEQVWTGITQVAGRVAFVNPDFRRGATLAKDTELVRIAAEDYQLAVTEAQAQIRSAEAKLAELSVSRDNTRELLKIEEESLALKQKSVDAKRALLDRGNVAQLSFDAELRDLLTQKKRVQDLSNALRLIPTQIAVQKEQIQVNKSRLQTAKLNLERTSIRLPFAARIASVGVEVSQFVQTGATIGVADGIATAEITAQYPLNHIRAFFDALRDTFKPEERTWKTRQDFAKAIGLHAVVRLKSGDKDAVWRGRVARLNDAFDEQTRTVGLIILVDEPYATARPGERPPLVKGMFVEVELRANPMQGMLVIPSSALYREQVYVVDKDSRLAMRDVRLGYQGNGFAVVHDGLAAGDRLVVSDVARPVPGMLLAAREDEDIKAELIRLTMAGGEVP